MTPQQSDWKWFLGMNHTVKLESIGRTSWYLTHWTTSAEQNFLCNFPLTLIFIFLSEPLTYFTGVLYGVWTPEYLYPAPADLTDICIWKKVILETGSWICVAGTILTLSMLDKHKHRIDWMEVNDSMFFSCFFPISV